MPFERDQRAHRHAELSDFLGAAEIRQLIEHCRTVVRERFGVTLREEIIYLGE